MDDVPGCTGSTVPINFDDVGDNAVVWSHNADPDADFNFLVQFLNTDLFLVYREDDSFAADEPLSEEQVDELINLLQQWKRWLHTPEGFE